MRTILVVASCFVSVFSTIVMGQSRTVVAIGPIDIAAQNISCDGWDRANCNEDLALGFRAMLETSLTRTGKMDVMERGQLDVIIAEQGIGQLGLTTSGGSVGGLTGVDYFVYGTITRFGAAESGTNVSSSSGVGSLFGGRAMSAFGGGAQTSQVTVEMGVDLKVSDVSTGRIIMADMMDASVQTGSAFSVGGISQAESSADPFGDVQRVLAAQISESIVTAQIPIKVIQVQGDGTLIVNYGDVILAPGDQLVAFEVGESFVDPDTGEVLGSEETEIGLVEITRAEARFSRGTIVGEPFSAEGATLRRLVN